MSESAPTPLTTRASPLQAHSDFALALWRGADGVDRKQQHLCPAIDMAFNGFKAGIDRAIAQGAGFDLLPLVLKDNFSGAAALRFAVLGQGDEVKNILGGSGPFHLHQGQDASSNFRSCDRPALLKLANAVLMAASLSSATPSSCKRCLKALRPELAQHDFVGGPAHIFGAHDFVSVTRLEHAILVDAAGVRKGVGPHHGLVRVAPQSR